MREPTRARIRLSSCRLLKHSVTILSSTLLALSRISGPWMRSTRIPKFEVLERRRGLVAQGFPVRSGCIFYDAALGMESLARPMHKPIRCLQLRSSGSNLLAMEYRLQFQKPSPVTKIKNAVSIRFNSSKNASHASQTTKSHACSDSNCTAPLPPPQRSDSPDQTPPTPHWQTPPPRQSSPP
jgi:hypothetical protein